MGVEELKNELMQAMATLSSKARETGTAAASEAFANGAKQLADALTAVIDGERAGYLK